MTDSTTRPPRTDCEHPDGAIRSMAPAFPDQWSCTRCGQRFMPQNAVAAFPDDDPAPAPDCDHPLSRLSWRTGADHPHCGKCGQNIAPEVVAAPAPDPEYKRQFDKLFRAAPAPDTCPKCGVLFTDTGYFEDGQRCHDPAPAPDPIEVLAEGLAERERFASKIGAAPAPEPAICSECDNPLIDGVCPIHGAPRKTFSGAQGDACRHCRLSRHSHPEPRLLCPEWALRASDGDR